MSTKNRILSWLVTLLSVFSMASGASAAKPNLACDGSIVEVDGLAVPPTPDRGTPLEGLGPLVVALRIELTELSRVDERAGSFRFESFGEFRLCDPRSAFDARAAGRETLRFVGLDVDPPIWNIKLHIANGIGPFEVTQRLVEIDANGSIRVFGHFSSEVGGRRSK